ncbi:MAG TPA: hypothetical protein VGN34_17665 [Ktedonobacteraceae bacterium]
MKRQTSEIVRPSSREPELARIEPVEAHELSDEELSEVTGASWGGGRRNAHFRRFRHFGGRGFDCGRRWW